MLGIKKDETIDAICKEVAEAYKNEFGKEINPDIVHNIAQSQFYLIEGAFRNQEVVKIDYVGKFVPVETRIERFKEKFGELKDSSLPLPKITLKAKGNEDTNTNGLSDRLRQIPNSEQDSGQKDYHSLRDEW